LSSKIAINSGLDANSARLAQNHRQSRYLTALAAVDAFYVKILSDDRVKHFFSDVNMASQHRKQRLSCPQFSMRRFPGLERIYVPHTRISTSKKNTSVPLLKISLPL